MWKCGCNKCPLLPKCNWEGETATGTPWRRVRGQGAKIHLYFCVVGVEERIVTVHQRIGFRIHLSLSFQCSTARTAIVAGLEETQSTHLQQFGGPILALRSRQSTFLLYHCRMVEERAGMVLCVDPWHTESRHTSYIKGTLNQPLDLRSDNQKLILCRPRFRKSPSASRSEIDLKAERRHCVSPF